MAKSKASRAGKNPTIKGANAADKETIALARAANKADAKAQVTKRGDQAPEAKATKAAKSAAADRLFEDADAQARSGLPHNITKAAHENHVRRAALGY